MNFFLFFLIFLLQFFIILSSKIIEKNINILYPSGIILDPIESSDGKIYRYGRLQLGAVRKRPAWETPHVIEGETLFSSEEERLNFIKRVEEYVSINGWSKNRHIDYAIRPTQDLPVRSLFPTSEEYENFLEGIHQKIFPYYNKYYDLDHNKLKIGDLFITKYTSNKEKMNSLLPHLDKSLWSFVINLNDDYEGGGTYFPHIDNEGIKTKGGEVIIFHGKMLHGANPISSGSRYILAGFCDYGLFDELGIDAYNEFLTLYDPYYDGYAAGAGFMNGDLIIGMSKCTKSKKDGKVKKKMVEITTEMSNEEFSKIGTTCEKNLPEDGMITFRIRRLVEDEDEDEL